MSSAWKTKENGIINLPVSILTLHVNGFHKSIKVQSVILKAKQDPTMLSMMDTFESQL